jgi:hypothetical protein
MQIRQCLKMVLAVVVLWIGLAIPVMAANNQSNQAMNQPASLISPEPSFEIGVYPKPNSSPKRIGFGLGGDRLTILEQVGSNEGDTWDYVRFENPKQVEGWVKDEFVMLQEGDSFAPRVRFAPKVHNTPRVGQNSQQPNPPGNPSRNGYQGNLQQSYRQQTQYP